MNQLKGYLKAFELLNNDNYEACDYFIEELPLNKDYQTSINDFLLKTCVSKEGLSDFDCTEIQDWKEALYYTLDNYFFRNQKLTDDRLKIAFIDMISNYINGDHITVLASGIKNGYSSLSKFIHEVSGADYVFVFKDKVLLLHLGIND
ncbi:hypothetical protein [Clostridium manihotivorum]|uniref:hypothetical protein n=1 Tax=Clostridium manihotivorum TaxID=2320868 RepID=UPI000FE3BEFF|nr:hypothetical protein [Clostridium manihotivorum]